jgi:preprotein translocase, secG subunit
MIIVLQTSKENASSAFSGEKSSVQKQRGAEKVINNITTVLSIAFFVVAILAVILR